MLRPGILQVNYSLGCLPIDTPVAAHNGIGILQLALNFAAEVRATVQV
jgi:hypothetical protein